MRVPLPTAATASCHRDRGRPLTRDSPGEQALTQQQLQKLISYDATQNTHGAAISIHEVSGVTGDGLGSAFVWLGQQVRAREAAQPS